MSAAVDAGTAGGALRDLTRTWTAGLRGLRPRVVLADGDDPRAVEAARLLADRTPIVPVLVTEHDHGGGVERLSPAPGGGGGPPPPPAAGDPRLAAGLGRVLARRAKAACRRDGTGPVLTPDAIAGLRAKVRDELLADPLYIGAAAVRAGLADACVGGASRPTADVIRAGLGVLGLGTGATTVSSCMLLALPDGRLYAYGDCAVIPDPDAEQLADITLSTSRTFGDLTGRTPVVAMLSFSTKGSAEDPAVHRVRTATGLVRARCPGLAVDGELQFDAAVIGAVAARKAPDSPVAGQANVFVFPNLAAGNIGYKITEQLAGAAVVGPVLQGLAAPMNDLSRGCDAAGIVRVALVSAVQAAHRQPLRRSAGAI